jgi:hypothetical protein
VLFGWLSDQTFFREITDINTMNKLKQRNEDELLESLLPVGFNNMMDDDSELMNERDFRNWFNY